MTTFTTAAATHTLAIVGDTLFASVPLGGDIAAEIARVAEEIGGEKPISTDVSDYTVVNAYEGDSFDEDAAEFRDHGTAPGQVVFSGMWSGTWIVGKA